MSKPKPSVYLSLERKIASGEGHSILDRWRYGRRLLIEKVGRKQLPQGKIDGLMADARANGFKISRREIQNRLRLAEAYDSAAKVRTAVHKFGSWTELRDNGFPDVEIDPSLIEPGDLEDLGFSVQEPLDWEQPTIPGLRDTVTVGGAKIPIADATVADVDAYEDFYTRIHEGFGKKLDKLRHSRTLMHEGCDGDTSMKAVEAWRRGMKRYLGDDSDPP